MGRAGGMIAAAVMAMAFAAVATAAETAETGKFDPAAYFSGKTVRIIVGFRAGGGTDIQARHFAAHWGDVLAGKPRFAVTNVTPDVAAMNLLYESKPDGLTIEMTPASYVSEQFTDDQAKFDVAKLRIIGTHNGSSSIMIVRKDFPYATLRDAVGGKTVLRVAGIRPDSGFEMRIAAMSQWLNVPVKFVSGRNGTAQGLIGLERGDIDGYLPGGGGGTWYSLPFIRPGWFKDGTVRAWANMGPTDVKIGPNGELPAPDKVPYVTELLKDPEQKRLYDIFAEVDAKYGKIFMAPPGTPEPVLDALRQSYAALLADAAFSKKLEEIMGEPVNYQSGDKVEHDLRQMVADYGANAKKFEEWITWARERF